jgi:dipeptidyl aminopeptidase/acylaminoacyl peptidase
VKKHTVKFFKFIFFFVLPVTIISVFIISYLAMQRLVFHCDRTLMGGEKLSAYAKRRRAEILKNKNIKQVKIETKDGLTLAGFLLKRKNAIGNMLVCHGYQSCKEKVADLFDMFDNYNMLAFDFRTHGQSDGRFRTLGCHEYKDVIAAVNFLKEKTKQRSDNFSRPLPFVIFGFSMGGSSALYALDREPNLCDAFIVDSSFADLKNVIYNTFTTLSGLPCFPFINVIEKVVNFFARCDIRKMCPLKSVEKMKQPAFFIHSCLDKIVQPNDSLLMYAHAKNEDTKLWVGPFCGHTLLRKYCYNRYKKKIDKFLKTVLS